MFDCWAIRHKPTGAWMPARMFKTASRGWSYWTPGDAESGYDGFDKSPRLFFSIRAARVALNAWLAGKWEVKMVSGCGPFDPPEPGNVAPTKPQVERKREDMEIVRFEMKERGSA